jgi:hypothetical protein
LGGAVGGWTAVSGGAAAGSGDIDCGALWGAADSGGASTAASSLAGPPQDASSAAQHTEIAKSFFILDSSFDASNEKPV